jgi:hypothetical protein
MTNDILEATCPVVALDVCRVQGRRNRSGNLTDYWLSCGAKDLGCVTA